MTSRGSKKLSVRIFSGGKGRGARFSWEKNLQLRQNRWGPRPLRGGGGRKRGRAQGVDELVRITKKEGGVCPEKKTAGHEPPPKRKGERGQNWHLYPAPNKGGEGKKRGRHLRSKKKKGSPGCSIRRGEKKGGGKGGKKIGRRIDGYKTGGKKRGR